MVGGSFIYTIQKTKETKRKQHMWKKRGSNLQDRQPWPDQVRQPPTRPMCQNKFRTCIFPYFFICRKDGEKKKILT